MIVHHQNVSGAGSLVSYWIGQQIYFQAVSPGVPTTLDGVIYPPTEDPTDPVLDGLGGVDLRRSKQFMGKLR